MSDKEQEQEQAEEPQAQEPPSRLGDLGLVGFGVLFSVLVIVVGALLQKGVI